MLTSKQTLSVRLKQKQQQAAFVAISLFAVNKLGCLL